MKKQNGITLIALIITIIVMLILVGVTVNVALNGGLFDTAKQATERTETAMIQEELSVIEATMNADILANPEKYTTTNDDAGAASIATTILQELQKYFIVEKYVTEDGTALDIAKIEEDGLVVFDANEMKMRFTLPCKYKDYEGNVIVIAAIGENIKIESFELKFKFPVYFDKSLLTDEDLAFYESLSQEDKKTYEGVWLGAYTFSNNSEYAGKIISNDFDATTLINTFVWNGFFSYKIGTLNNLAMLMYRPDGSINEIINDTNPLEYFMDSDYNMYEYNENTKQLKNSNGTIIAANAEVELNSDPEETEYNGYKYIKRFDNKSVLITAVPDQEVLDMKTDLAELNVYSINAGLFDDTSIKRVILPDSIETLLWLAIGRTDSDSANGMFEDATSLEYVELSNNIQVLYTHTFENCTNLQEVIMPDNITTIEDGAFTGCDGVTLKFKDVNNIPEGQPWGGTNLNIVSK